MSLDFCCRSEFSEVSALNFSAGKILKNDLPNDTVQIAQLILILSINECIQDELFEMLFSFNLLSDYATHVLESFGISSKKQQFCLNRFNLLKFNQSCSDNENELEEHFDKKSR